LLGRFVDEVLVAHSGEVALPLLAGLVLAALVRAALLALQARLVTHTFNGAANDAARRFVAHALRLPMTFYAQRSPSALAARVELNARAAQAVASDVARLAQRLMLVLGEAPALLGLAAQLAVLGIGAARIVQGGFTVGDLVAYQVLLAGFEAPLHALFAGTRQLQRLRGDLARIEDVLHHEPDPALAGEAADVPTIRLAGQLEFRDVTFGYDRNAAPLVEGLSFVLRPGGRVALVGASGCGKSTVARLAAGLYVPWSGEILFDGAPREAHEREHLAAALAYVDQDIVLFEGTVRENLTLWKGADEERLRRALADAALDEELAARGGGLDTPLEEGARNLSGGQRQRLEIARALAGEAVILVLDEATSALDAATEARVEANLRRRRLATLVIAHRLSTVRDADEILVLDAGHVVERGTHVELMALGGRYAALVATGGAA